MTDRARAIADIVTLARAHGVTVKEIATALGEDVESTTQGHERRGVVVRSLGYLGGTFVFAGLGVFIALQWTHMNAAARIVVTLGSGLAAFALALLADCDSRFEKAATPLVLIAAALMPTGMLVAFSELGSGGDWRWAAVVTFATVALQFGAAFSALRRASLLYVAVVYAAVFWWIALDLADVDASIAMITVGAALLLASVGVDRTRFSEITPSWYFVGAIMFLYGVFDTVEDTPAELLFVAVAASVVYLAVVCKSRALLFVGTLAILAYTGYFTGEHFAESIGWPLALVAFGLFMIALSALAVRLDRNYVRSAAADSTGAVDDR
jgi:hypothetical protein